MEENLYDLNHQEHRKIVTHMETNLYEVLGVDRKADANEIKKAYRDLSKIHHPDKGGDPERFKEINNAYEILSDEQKRQMYDITGSTKGPGGGGPGGFGGFGGFGPFGFGPGGIHMNVDMSDIFGAMFGGPGGQGARAQQRQQKRPKGPTKTHEVGLRLHDFYHGKTFQIDLGRQIFCDICHGEGCKNWKTCADCKGAGVKETMMQLAPGMMAVNRGPCTACSGEGRQRGSPCENCQSKGLVSSPKTIEVVIKPGSAPGDVLIFEGMCSDNLQYEKPGDVQIRLAAVEEELDVEREGSDLKTHVSIRLGESLLGCKRKILHHPAGELEVEIPVCVQNGETIVVEGKGMPVKEGFGKLLIVVTVLPSKEEKKTVENSKAILQSLFSNESI